MQDFFFDAEDQSLWFRVSWLFRKNEFRKFLYSRVRGKETRDRLKYEQRKE
jgi:hypothetical protein